MKCILLAQNYVALVGCICAVLSDDRSQPLRAKGSKNNKTIKYDIHFFIAQNFLQIYKYSTN